MSLKQEWLCFPSSYFTVGREVTHLKFNTITGKRQSFYKNLKVLYLYFAGHMVFFRVPQTHVCVHKLRDLILNQYKTTGI